MLPVPPPQLQYGEPPGAEGGVEQEEKRIVTLGKVKKDLTELGQDSANLLRKLRKVDRDSQKKGGGREREAKTRRMRVRVGRILAGETLGLLK